MTAYYNEIEPFAAQWLRNLIDAGQIAPGEVDERSIEDVTPGDLRGYTQHHFFAGVGVWSYALRQAGWPDSKPVWTGSCPCQPFSAAGKGNGFDDERHLWPAFQWLIDECKPEHIFGEQVASGNANDWFDLVQTDLEGMGYAFGLTPFTAASIGAPHIRERAYWVANSSGERIRAEKLAITHRKTGALQSDTREWERLRADIGTGNSTACGMGNTNVTRLERLSGDDSAAGWQRKIGSASTPGVHSRTLEVNGFWRDADWLFCRDGQWRPVEPGTFPLVARFAKSMGHGKSSLRAMAGRNRTGRLKGYGNAINAEAAKAFISAYMECMPCASERAA